MDETIHIDFNTKLRTAATNDFEKISLNSVFGKTMENIRKHRNIKLVTNKDKDLRMVMKPNFKSGVLFGENLMGCEMGCTSCDEKARLPWPDYIRSKQDSNV